MTERVYSTIIALLLLCSNIAMGAVPVILTAGQSNADGRVPMTELPEYIHYDHCQWSYGSGDFLKASGMFKPFAPTVGRKDLGNRWGFDAIVYYLLEQHWQQPFYVIKQTMGGTAIDTTCTNSTHGWYWSVDAQQRSLVKAFCQQIDDCLSQLPKDYDIKCLLWHQGESDMMAADRYHDNLKAVVTYIRQHLVEKTGRKEYGSLPVVCATFAKGSRQGSPKVAANRYGFWAKQMGDLYFEGNRMGVDAALFNDKEGNGLLVVGDSLNMNFEQTDLGIVITVNAAVSDQGPKFARTAFPVISKHVGTIKGEFCLYCVDAHDMPQTIKDLFMDPQTVPAPFHPFETQYDTYLLKYNDIKQ